MKMVRSIAADEHVHAAAERAILEAKSAGGSVILHRNETEVLVHPTDLPNPVVDRYLAAMRAGQHTIP